MPPDLSASGLLRSIGLQVDGPSRWGSTPPSRAPGIFAVEVPEPADRAPIDPTAVRRWLERVPDLRLDGERPTVSALAERLATFWIPGATLLYVGRTTRHLTGRVGALYATELGSRRPHSGGYWLKTLREQSRLRLWWAETEAPEEYEDALVTAFAELVRSSPGLAPASLDPLLPWANLESPTGGRRHTGLTGALLDIAEDPGASTAVRRSSGSAIRRRPPAATSTTASRAPRRRAGKPEPGASGKEPSTPVTAAGLAAMQAEHEQLTTVERPQVVGRVKSARELGDLRENADYEAARNEQSFLEGRILELEQKLRTAVIIESGTNGAIALGSTVRYESDGDTGELTIVGSTESDPSAGRISAVSPVGRALMGHRVGDEVTVRTPAAEIRYRILAIG